MVGSRYAVADLHGQLDLLMQIKGFINETDIVYILGDSGDRGSEPWRTLKASLDDPQFVYIMGNHDLLLTRAINDYLRIEQRDGYVNLFRYLYDKGPIALLARNGGLGTLEGWAAEPNRMEYYWKLRSAPLELRLAALDGKHFIYLTHAGYTPGYCEPNNVYDFVWDRNHIYDLPNPDNHLIIYGHTPAEIVAQSLTTNSPSQTYEMVDGCCIHSGGTKMCIDVGAPFYNRTVLLDIDSLETKIFTTKGENVDGAQGK